MKKYPFRIGKNQPGHNERTLHDRSRQCSLFSDTFIISVSPRNVNYSNVNSQAGVGLHACRQPVIRRSGRKKTEYSSDQQRNDTVRFYYGVRS